MGKQIGHSMQISGDFNKHNLKKIGDGQGKKYSVGQCRICAAHKKHSEMTNMKILPRSTA
jgi:hypothetical protein